MRWLIFVGDEVTILEQSVGPGSWIDAGCSVVASLRTDKMICWREYAALTGDMVDTYVFGEYFGFWGL